MSLDELNRLFSIEHQLQFVRSHGDLISLHIQNSFAEAEIVLQGGQLIHWSPRSQSPVIWLSDVSDFKPGEAIRGGIPICWPWFGPHEQQADYPAHGFARTQLWEVVDTKSLETGEIVVRLTLPMSKESATLWSHSTRLEVEFTIGEYLCVELFTTNLDEEPVVISEALHSYFSISDIYDATVEGLDNIHFVDKLADNNLFKQQDNIGFDREIDRVYINTSEQCVINDPAFKRRIVIDKSNSLSTVIWNPWQQKSHTMKDMNDDSYLGMLCVETANVLSNKVTIGAGQQHSIKLMCRIDALKA